LNSNPIIKIAYEWLESSLDDAIDFTHNKVKNIIYKNNIMLEEIPGLIKRIEIGVPPNESFTKEDKKISDWRSAILASWLFLLSDKISEIDDKYPEISHQDLFGLTRKAIEYIYVTNKYLKK